MVNIKSYIIKKYRDRDVIKFIFLLLVIIICLLLAIRIPAIRKIAHQIYEWIIDAMKMGIYDQLFPIR